MLDGLPGILRSSQQQCIRTSWRSHGELVNGQTLAAGLLNPRTGSRGEAKSGDMHLWNCEEAIVVCDGADNDDGLVPVLFGGVLGVGF